MIRSFRDAETEKVFRRRESKKLPPEIQRRAHRKLLLLHAARHLDDLHSPPGNHLESLCRDRAGQHSIRVNDQWRLCFGWDGGDASKVELCDYHH